MSSVLVGLLGFVVGGVSSGAGTVVRLCRLYAVRAMDLGRRRS
jgi:hypothetical protein